MNASVIINVAPAVAAGLLMMASPSSARTVCSVFDQHPCQPALPYPFSDGLRVTIQAREQPATAPSMPLNTLQELFHAMGACWVPPPLEQARPGTEITILFSLNRSGDIIGEPRFTYSTHTLPNEIKAAYQRSVADMLKRCAPFPISSGLGGAIAGRPIAMRFIDDRGSRRTENRHER